AYVDAQARPDAVKEDVSMEYVSEYDTYKPYDPERAERVEDMYKAFEPEPLGTPKAMEEFYIDTMAVRTGDAAESPIKEIEKACRRPRERNVFLLLGHRGCGKSTELNRMKLRLLDQGRPVRTIQCEMELQLVNQPEYSDLLILMADALLRMAEELGVDVTEDTLRTIRSFWKEGVQTIIEDQEFSAETGAGVKAASPKLIKKFLDLFVEIKGNVKYNRSARVQYEEKITQRFSEWLTVIRRLSDGIAAKAGKQPVLIFEGLDKMEQDAAEKVFFRHPESLSNFAFPVVYTFPIALYYDPGFAAMNAFFTVVTFPMLKLRSIDDTPFPAGYDAIRDIVRRRVAPSLIDEDALRLLIEKTGGSLRDLFRAIYTAADRAENRERDHVDLSDAQRALVRMKSDITRMIQGEEHQFLAKIASGGEEERTEIKDRETLLRMLQARTVMEYNGQRWFNVHPLVADYLKELGYVQ
ncbi:MAG: hypothetical protein IJT94_07805, partial [Oscillibacter sp.]|nr:hypothetical protein [Oscillibacter sp.]